MDGISLSVWAFCRALHDAENIEFIFNSITMRALDTQLIAYLLKFFTEIVTVCKSKLLLLAICSSLSWSKNPIAINLGISQRIAVLLTGVTGVSLDGINPAVFHLFHDSHMVDPFVLIPIKKDKVTGIRRVGIVLPLSPFLKPGNPWEVRPQTWGTVRRQYSRTDRHQETKQAHHSTWDSNPYQLQ